MPVNPANSIYPLILIIYYFLTEKGQISAKPVWKIRRAPNSAVTPRKKHSLFLNLCQDSYFPT